MNADEIETLNSNDWNKCLEVIEEHWNTDYGNFELCKEKNGTETLELTTGGWSENEALIDEISSTMFWFLWWQISKRGGYYKFVYVTKMQVEVNSIEQK